MVVNEEEEEEEEEVGKWGGGVHQSHQGQKLFFFFALLFFAMKFLKLVMVAEDNQDNVGNKEEVDNEGADKEERVDIMGRRRRMRRCLQDH